MESRSRQDPENPPGLRWSLVAHLLLFIVALGTAGFGLYECSGIASSEILFRETLGGKPLPLMTQWVLQYRAGFVMAAMFVPGAALATFALRERRQAMGALAAVILFGMLHALFVCGALMLPLIEITKQMGSGS